MIVEESQADPLIEQLKIHMVKIRVGNGLDPQTTMGPLVSQGQMETVAGYVRKGLEDRATLVVGGRPLVEDPCARGLLLRADTVRYVSPNSALAREEIFGPVLPLIRVHSPDEAFEVANSTRYGWLPPCSRITGTWRMNLFIAWSRAWFTLTTVQPARLMFRSEA